MWRDRLVKYFSDPHRVTIFHNAKFDVRMLEIALKFTYRCKVHDTRFAAHMCNSLEPTCALKPLSDKYLGIGTEDQDELIALVRKLRNRAAAMGFQIGVKRNWIPRSKNNKYSAESDYWIPRLFNPTNRLCQVYAIMDTERTMLLWLMYRDLMKELEVEETYNREMKLWHVNYAMEGRGVCIDGRALKIATKRTYKAMDVELQAVRDFAGKDFNPNSFKQMQWLLYTKLGYEVKFYTKKPKNKDAKDHTPQPAANWEALIEHSEDEIVATLLRYRAAEKSEGSFLHHYRELKVHDPISGGWVIHPNFNQCGPCTGRYSSNDPNLQNISYGMTAMSRGVVPFSVRMCFRPRPGYSWVYYDYKQLEARLFADVAEEPFMLEAFAAGRDFHTECCNKAWGYKTNPDGCLRAVRFVLRMDNRAILPDDKIMRMWVKYKFKGLNELDSLQRGIGLSPESLEDADRVAMAMIREFDGDLVALEASVGEEVSRNKAKTLLFCRIFGGGVKAAARLIKCTEAEARQFMKDYSVEFPRIDEFINEMSSLGRSQGYIRNRSGRLLAVDPRYSYRAVNYVIQSLAADLLKRAMYRSSTYFRQKGIDAHLVATIHDELVFEVNNKYITPYITDKFIKKEKPHWAIDSPVLNKIKRIMENSGGYMTLPTPVDLDISPRTWDDKIHVALSV